jgi:tetratricopeptide (TPR) repeat protein
LLQKTDVAAGLKASWFGLVSILLGPFALWFILFAKLRRRSLIRHSFPRNILLTGAFLAFQIFLFLAPVHWALLLAVYVVTSLGTAWFMTRQGRGDLFRLGGAKASDAASGGSAGGENGASERWAALRQCFIAAAMAIYPLVYIMALLHNIGELDNFSIRLPSDVYTDGLLWMIYATPLVASAGLAAWAASLRPGIRTLIHFYAAVTVVLGWIMVWEKLDLFLQGMAQGPDRETLLFPFRMEQAWRSGVKAVFYGGAFLLGIGYLIGARRTAVFSRRALFLGLPSLLLYADMLFALGDWNYYLAGMRERGFNGHDYGLYRYIANAQAARTPSAYGMPDLLEEWAELEYQTGDTAKAGKLYREMDRKCRGKAYFAKSRKRSERILESLAKPFPASESVQLDLPIIKQASYLDKEWFALLSAVAFLKPGWTDLEMKKRLLELSNTVQLHLPRLENVPDLIPALRQLDLPVTTCFLTSGRIKAALASGKVPFLSLYGDWVPVSGYDPARDGFYYYAYGAPGGFDWFRNEDTDLFYHHAGEAFGGETERKKTRAFKYSMQKLVPRDELEAHILDVGGVGLILGDSTVADAQERKAAYLVELGDLYYQDHENYQEAAAAYKQAAALHPGDQVWSRMVYLKRRYMESAADEGDYKNLFRDYPPEWMAKLGPDAAVERDILAKIMAGRLGTFLMVNWYMPPPPDTSAESKAAMDTAVALFRGLRAQEPEEPAYIDSLATLLARKGELKESEGLFGELAKLYPYENESVLYRLAWTKMKLGKIEELPPLLARCRSYDEEAKYLTMKGAVSMRKGRYRNAYASLSRSLKVDKTIPETHALLAEWFRRKGNEPEMRVHQTWQRRSG